MEEIDLKEILKTAWNKKWNILFILMLFVIAGIIYSTQFIVPKYTSSTTLILASINRTYDEGINSLSESDTAIMEQDITLNSKLVSTYSELIKSKNVLRQVKSNLNIDIDENELRQNVVVSAIEDTELIKITVTDYDNVTAMNIANEISSVFMEKIKDIYNIENVQVVDEAEISTTPSNINLRKDVMIFVFIGMLVSIVYVFILNMLDTTIKSVEDIEKTTGIVCLAAFPMYYINTVTKKKGRNK